ncbi:hypothetical protein [Leptolyngbya sp. FACHB-8]|uniref:hypothetical protein n=1 Tax=unclassified Leptolyngbya TaxID=2650499 RepID=UPI0016899A73|nr:hypothetical protein [Leptolyngbya sp. FACHB-8]MBD1911285.1 hypothetical protein [Leptolyngbya sp. FACHB-8]
MMAQNAVPTETLTDNSHFLPIANFTDSRQALALAEKFGDRDLGKLSPTDQTALVLILSRLIYHDHIQKPIDIWEAAEQAISEDEDQTSDDMATALELLEGIDSDGAIALIQFLVQ